MFAFRETLIASAVAILFASNSTGARSACYWSVDAPPTVADGQAILHSVAPISATDAWAVGYYRSSRAASQAIAEHFNGSAWQSALVPKIPGSRLLGVKAISNNDVWAVGSYKTGGSTQPLAEHWDGRTWRAVPVPAVLGTMETELLAIYAIARDDVWAVGCAMNATRTFAVTAHWNGLKWTLVPTPQPNLHENVLYTVTANRSNNVWALGNQGKYQSKTNPRRSLALHWNGTAWSVVPSPNFGTAATINYFYASAFVPGTDHVWGVGQYQGPKAFYTMTSYWSGTHWSLVPSPNPAANGDFLLGLLAKDANDVWSVGTYYDASMIRRNFAMHWDGASWSNAAMPNENANMNELFDVEAVPGTNGAIAAGDFYTSATDRRPETAQICAL